MSCAPPTYHLISYQLSAISPDQPDSERQISCEMHFTVPYFNERVMS
jgi:hypothetical protein